MTPHPLSEEARGTGWAEMAEELPRNNFKDYPLAEPAPPEQPAQAPKDTATATNIPCQTSAK